MTKVCCTCKIKKEFSEFNKLKCGKYGLQHRCRECQNKKNREYRKNNDLTEYYKKRNALESNKLAKKKWRQNNIEYYALYKKNNKDKINYINTKRRVQKKTSQLCKDKYKTEIQNLYNKAQKLKLQVDHIIPLLHNNVCGLHVPWNLQLLTPLENNIKNNSFDGTLDNESWRVNAKKVI